jgi:predicted HicB family RNase H-like nuclease
MKLEKKSFALRLPVSVHHDAERMAFMEGVSLNQFITLAVTEKITRLETSVLRMQERVAKD